jgi:hypothetical protein
VVTETVVAGTSTNNSELSPAQLPAVTDQPMPPINDGSQPETAGRVQKRNEHQPHAKGWCRPSMHGEIKANGEAMSRSCRYEVGKSAGYMGPVAAPQKASATEITGMVPAQRRQSRFGSSSNRYADQCLLSEAKQT